MLALLIAFLVGVSRIYVGVHYPLDVFAGIIVGVAGAYSTNNILNQFWNEKT